MSQDRVIEIQEEELEQRVQQLEGYLKENTKNWRITRWCSFCNVITLELEKKTRKHECRAVYMIK